MKNKNKNKNNLIILMFNCGFLFIQISTHGKYNEGSEVVKTRYLN